MKRTIALWAAAAVMTAVAAPVALAGPPPDCATIRDGTILDSGGNPVELGFDEFGYNYQAHLFVGTFDSVDRNIDGTYWGQSGDFVDDQLVMKWSDDWLSNKDCDFSGKLDRGGDGDDVGSLGWLTNAVTGDYIDSDGVERHYTSFDKIVWVGSGGDLWGQYTVIQSVLNDPADGTTGLQLKTAAPGFGLNDHWTTSS